MLERFYDLKEREPREAGEVFEVTEARLAQINSAGFGRLVAPADEAERRDYEAVRRSLEAEAAGRETA